MKNPENPDLFREETEYALDRLAQTKTVDEKGNPFRTGLDPREISEIFKHAARATELGMSQPGSREAALLNNVARAIDEKTLKLASEDAA